TENSVSTDIIPQPNGDVNDENNSFSIKDEVAKYEAELVKNKKGASQSLNMQSPQFTSKTPLATAPNTVNVQQKDNNVKRSTKDEAAAAQSGLNELRIYTAIARCFSRILLTLFR
ncbi:MAG: hypothetical protein RSB97_08135, partial [Christensenella sp.]